MLNFGNKKKNESEATPAEAKAKGKDFFAERKEVFDSTWVEWFEAAERYDDEDKFFQDFHDALWEFVQGTAKASYANGIATASSRSRKQNH